MLESTRSNSNAPRFMSIRQAAAAGPLSEYTLRVLAKRKMLPCIYSGNRALINYDALFAQLNDPDSLLMSRDK